MRVISQDGIVDMPYEHICISVNRQNPKAIMAWHILGDDVNDVCIAIYSTEEKALKAMEMLRESYDKGIFVPNDKHDPDYGGNWHANAKSFYYRTSVFQFPADDEIEV